MYRLFMKIDLDGSGRIDYTGNFKLSRIFGSNEQLIRNS